MKIYTNIKLLRNKLNLSQSEFADKLGMTLRGIQNWEAGKGDVKSAKISLINSIFHANVNWLLTGDGEMFITDDIDFQPRRPLNPEIPDIKRRAINEIYTLSIDETVAILAFIENLKSIKAAETAKKKAM